MGTDIYGFFQVKTAEKWSRWDYACPVPGGRDYELFGLLAGVRGDAEEGLTDPKPPPPLSEIPIDYVADVVELQAREEKLFFTIEGKTLWALAAFDLGFEPPMFVLLAEALVCRFEPKNVRAVIWFSY